MGRIFSDQSRAAQLRRAGSSAPGRALSRYAPLVALSLLAGLGSGCRRSTTGAEPSPSASAAAPAKPATIRFEPLPSRLGQKVRNVRKSALRFSVEFWKDGEKLGTNESSRVEEYSRTQEVTGLIGGTPGKVTVHYDRYHLVARSAGKEPLDDSTIEGKTYALDASQDQVTVATPEGKAVPSAEEETLRGLHADLGKDDPVVAVLGRAPTPIGVTFPMKEGLFRAVFGAAKGEGEFKSGSITLVETREEGGRPAGVFQWSAEMETQQGSDLTLTWHLQGRTIVAISPAMTLSSSITGTLDGSGHKTESGARVEMAGAGTFEDQRTNTPL